MSYATYRDANDAAMAHYRQGEYAPALDILTQAIIQFPANRIEADYLRACFAVRLENAPLAYQILDALYAEDIWFSETIFRDSPSFAPLQGNPEFEQRVKAHAELRTRTASSGPAPLLTLNPAGDSASQSGMPHPVIFHLHGNGTRPNAELPNWQPAADKGWLVVAPTAEYVFWGGGNPIWPDHESAERQLTANFANLKKEHAIDENQIILTGFSMGGDVAIAQTLKGEVVKSRGFLVVGPGGPMIDEPETYCPLIEAAQGRGIRGVIMVSNSDPAIQPDKATQLAQLLNDGGIPCRFVFYPDVGHVYPADFDKRLADALAFILKGE